MNGDLKRLYPALIKEHNETPFHFEKKSEAAHSIKAYNPICGDRFEIFIDSDLKKIISLHFHGYGCAISKASTSVLTKSLEGKTLEDALSVCKIFLGFINKDQPSDSLTLPIEFTAFSGVHDFPERYDCATLAWKEMKMFLERNL
jgi:nitrogen fixation protein NifU and related proteins